MKAGKILLIIQAVFMYIAIFMFIAAFAIAVAQETNPEADSSVVQGLLIGKFVVNFIPLNLALVSILIGFISIFKKPKDPTKYSMIIKLVLIPFYILNFIEWVILGIGTLNPFLFILGALLIVFGILFTYICMLATGIYNIGYVFGLIKEGKANGLMIAALIFQFVYVLDIVGAIILYIENKKFGEINEN